MIKLRNDSIKTMMMVILFPVIFFSCIEEEMTCERVPMAVHYVGAGGSVVTRGTEISSADDLKGTKFGLKIVILNLMPLKIFSRYGNILQRECHSK